MKLLLDNLDMRSIDLQAPADITRGLSVTLISTYDELQRVVPQWLKLLETGTVGHNVDNDPRMVSFELQQHPELIPHIVLVWRDGVLVCVAPFYVKPARYEFEFAVWRFLSLRAKVMRVFGESVVLAKTADPEKCVDLIAEALKHDSLESDYLQVYGLIYADDFWRAALSENAFSRRSGWKRFAMRREKAHKLVLKDSFDEYVASLNKGTRRTLCWRRRLYFRKGTARVEQYGQPCDVKRLLESMELIDRESWQGKTFGASHFTDGGHQLQVEQLAAEGWLRSYVIFRNDEPIAYQHGYQYGAVYYSHGTAYRQQFSADSPGSVLRFCVLEDLHANRRVETWDFGFGDLWYKQSLGNVADDAAIVYFVPRNRWRLVLRLQTWMNATYDVVRAALMRLRIDRFIRRILKRQQ